MRAAITLHRLHGEEHFQVVTGPEVPIDVQIEAIKKLARESGREHPEIAQAQLWTSSEGCRKRYKFSPGQPAVEESEEDEEKKAAAAKAKADKEAAALKAKADKEAAAKAKAAAAAAKKAARK